MVFNSPRPDFSSLSGNATIINNGTPQQFDAALLDPLVGTIIFVGHGAGNGSGTALNPFHAIGLNFGDNGANGTWYPPQGLGAATNADFVFIFACAVFQYRPLTTRAAGFCCASAG